jgi:hypothetical protein
MSSDIDKRAKKRPQTPAWRALCGAADKPPNEGVPAVLYSLE